MELNIASVEIEPKRHTFGHVARRLGEDRPASRYEEAMYDAQPTENFHYRPQWEPEFEIYDKARTQIKMNDWYDLQKTLTLEHRFQKHLNGVYSFT